MLAPPGGPVDSTPPHIVTVQPESGKIVKGWKGDAVIRFDEVIDEMGGTGTGGLGLSGLERQVVLSPVVGAVNVSWKRSALHVKPAEGWKAGRVYHLQVLPGITDLSRNVMKEGRTVIFSTGPALPSATLSGTVLQWVEQRVLAKAVIRAALLPDTAEYVVLADSTGAFSLSGIPAGRYRVYAIADQNGNRTLDLREPFDSQTVAVDSSAQTLLWAFVHDTVAPRFQAADPTDSTTFRLLFSQPLDPARALDTTRVHLFLLPDTSAVPLVRVWTAAGYDSVQTRERAVADSLKRARDTTARAGARPDTAGRAAALAVAQARAARGGAAARSSADSAVRLDTARIRGLLRQRPVPTERWVARAAQRLTPGAKYLVRVRGATNLSGAATTADEQTVLVVPLPKTAPPADSTRAAPQRSR
jgi:hypothetical protein